MSRRYKFKDKWLLRQVSYTKLLCPDVCLVLQTQACKPAHSCAHSQVSSCEDF